MHNKKFTKIFLYLSLPIILFIPVLNLIFLGDKLNKKNIYSVDVIESQINYLMYKKFSYFLIPKKIIIGKEDFLFLGNSFNNIINKSTGSYRPSFDEINNWTNKLKDLQNWYENRGIKFIIAIAPNKHSIYNEKLPNGLQYNGLTLTDDIVKSSQLKNINMIDLRPILKEGKDGEVLYWRTDSHWNEKGASIAYESIINYLNIKLKANIQKSEYSLIDGNRGGGDLAKLLKINTILASDIEKNYAYKFKNVFDICKGNINKESGVLEECKDIENPVIGINVQPQYTINKTMKDNKLLLICDSFGEAPSQLYNSSFNEIWKWHYGHINGQKLSEFVEINKPDVVIYQIVERALYESGITTPMPTITEVPKPDIKIGNLIFDIEQNNYNKNNQIEITIENEQIKLNALNTDPIIILDQTKADSKNIVLSYEIDSKIDTTFQLFYKKEISSNYNEIDSYIVTLNKGNNKFNLLLPSEYINNELRVDLVSDIGVYDIKEFKIYNQQNN